MPHRRETGRSAFRPIGHQVTTGAQQMHRRLLFLCTGNYYRSRFAEMLFNALTAQLDLNWNADSRGIATERGSQNIGPISPCVRAGLQVRGIEVGKAIRFPGSSRSRILHKPTCSSPWRRRNPPMSRRAVP